MTSGRGSPKISIKDASSINKELGLKPLQNGFVSVPVWTQINYDLNYDITYNSCYFADEQQNLRRSDDNTFLDYDWVKENVKEPLILGNGEPNYKIYEPATMDTINLWADGYIGRGFEGLSHATDDAFDDNTYF